MHPQKKLSQTSSKKVYRHQHHFSSKNPYRRHLLSLAYILITINVGDLSAALQKGHQYSCVYGPVPGFVINSGIGTHLIPLMERDDTLCSETLWGLPKIP